MSVPCMYMFVFFNNGMYYVCQLTYDSIVHSLYVHGTDIYVHVYARWSGFQMLRYRDMLYRSVPDIIGCTPTRISVYIRISEYPISGTLRNRIS